VPYAWHFMHGDDVHLHLCNGADWC
jgi:hypothetical protein